jgi:hypothetical protein
VEFHRELKQLTGVEACQCRKARIQRNHTACALLVWSCLKTLAYQTGRIVYQMKHGMLSNYGVAEIIMLFEAGMELLSSLSPGGK